LSVWESVLKAALGRIDRSQADIPQVSGHAKDLRQDLGRLHGVLADRDVLAEVVFQQWNAALSGLPGRVGSFWQQYGTANPQGTPSPVRSFFRDMGLRRRLGLELVRNVWGQLIAPVQNGKTEQEGLAENLHTALLLYLRDRLGAAPPTVFVHLRPRFADGDA